MSEEGLERTAEPKKKAAHRTGSAKRPSPRGTYADVAKKLDAIAERLAEMPSADGTPYMTSREQFNAYSRMMNRRDAELSDKKHMRMMEQLCAMREDFFRLCRGMEENLDRFTAEDILNSFKAYEVDMENILADAGVRIGPYRSESGKLDTMHQRIVGVVPTDDPTKNMSIAESLSEGYEYQGRVLLKERVNVFKTAGMPAQNNQ